MTDNTKLNVALLVALVVLVVAAGSCYEHDRRDCEDKKGGELHGWRERICVKPGSVIE